MTNTNKLVKIDKNVKFTTIAGSSMLSSYAREAGDLAVEFKNGTKYIYEGVDQATVDGFVAAPSKGKFLNANIIPKFPSRKAE
jgi:hypothetical protein